MPSEKAWPTSPRWPPAPDPCPCPQTQGTSTSHRILRYSRFQHTEHLVAHREWREILVFMGKPKGWTFFFVPLSMMRILACCIPCARVGASRDAEDNKAKTLRVSPQSPAFALPLCASFFGLALRQNTEGRAMSTIYLRRAVWGAQLDIRGETQRVWVLAMNSGFPPFPVDFV
jgi:hypothetical protein